MNQFLEALKQLGPLGTFLVGLIDGIGLPNPGGPDYLLLFVAWARPHQAYLSAFTLIAGSAIGTFILYSLARKGGERYLESKLKSPRAKRFRAWFLHYGLITVFIPTFVPMIPMPLKAFVLSSGALGVRPVPFMLTVLAGRVPRYLFLAYLGRSLGENSKQWLLDHKWHFGLAALGLLAFCFALIKITDRLRGPRGNTLVADHDS